MSADFPRHAGKCCWPPCPSLQVLWEMRLQQQGNKSFLFGTNHSYMLDLDGRHGAVGFALLR